MATAAIFLMLKATLVLGIAWVICRCAARASAAVRHGIWALALVSLVALPVVDGWLPAVHVELPAPLWIEPLDVLPTPAPDLAREAPFARSSDLVPASGGARVTEVVTPVAVSHRESGRPDWPNLLLLGWLTGVALRLVWLAALLVRTRQLAGRASRSVDRRHTELAASLAAEIGVRRRVRVLHSPFFSMPLAWGVFRPVITLPAGADQWPEERLRVVLLHELAHIRRWDYLTSLTGELACALYWPLPLVWMARRRLKTEQEQACDDRVLSTGTAPLDYADHLLAIARAFYGSRVDLGLAVTMAREFSLKHRIRAILDEELDRRPLRARHGVGMAAVLLAVVLPVAALSGAEATGDASNSDSLVASLPGSSTISIWMEAEAGSTNGSVWTDEDLEASGAAYLVLAEAGQRNLEAGGSASVEYRFESESSGEFLVWARLRRVGSGGASLSVAIDGGTPYLWELERASDGSMRDWTWVPIAGVANVGAGAAARLGAGEHSLQVIATAGQVRIDRLLVTSDPALRPADRGAPEPGFRASYRLLEAEAGERHGRIRSPDDARASGGESVTFMSARRSDPAGAVTFSFDLADAGRYIIWGRVFAPDDDSNSLFASVNGGPELIWDVPDRDIRRDHRSWEWDPISARDDEGRAIDPVLFDLPSGRNELTLTTREAGVRLDAILVTNDLVLRPRGLWPESLPAEPAEIWIEAESGQLWPPLVVQAGPAASGGEFLVVNEIRGDRSGPGRAGSARYQFSVAEPGIYSLWGRTIAASDDEDSFWLRLDGHDWIRWNDIPKGDGWTWSAAHDSDSSNQIVQFRLAAGDHTIELAGREGGVMLDRLLLTNDPLIEAGMLP